MVAHEHKENLLTILDKFISPLIVLSFNSPKSTWGLDALSMVLSPSEVLIGVGFATLCTCIHMSALYCVNLKKIKQD
jgi:hypothetical protein